MSNFIRGFTGVLGAFGRISQYGLWPYVFLTGLFGLIFGGLVFYSVYNWAGLFGDWMVSAYPFEWGSETIAKLSDYVGGSLMVIGGLLVFKYIILAVTSPVMSFVSEKVEYKLTGERQEGFSVTRMIGEFIRGIRLSISNLVKELFYLFCLFLLGVILPFLAPFIGVISFLLQAFYAGFGSLDYYMERRFNVQESKYTARKHRWGVTGIGSGFLVILLIPVLGWILAPVLSTIAATEYAIDQDIDSGFYETV